MQHLLEFVEVEPDSPAQYSVIWLHGLGADGYDFHPIASQLELQEHLGVRFVFPHAPIRAVSLNAGMHMRAWFDIVKLGPEHQADEDGLLETEKAIVDLIERELERGVPSKNIILAGFSQGGAAVLFTGLRYDKPLGGIIALSTYVPHSAQEKFGFNPANKDTNIFMAHGVCDTLVKCHWGEMTKSQLQEVGYKVDWKTYPMEHSVSPEEVKDIGAWINKVFGA